MELATRINHLLEHHDVVALELTDAQHPGIIVQLDVNGPTPEADGLVECAISEAQETGHAGSLLRRLAQPARIAPEA